VGGLSLPFSKEASFDQRHDLFEQIFSLQIWTWFTVGEITALPGPRFVNRATRPHPTVTQKDTGTVIPDPEGVFTFQIALPYLAVSNLQISGNPINIGRIEVKARAFQSITAITGTIIAVYALVRQQVLLIFYTIFQAFVAASERGYAGIAQSCVAYFSPVIRLPYALNVPLLMNVIADGTHAPQFLLRHGAFVQFGHIGFEHLQIFDPHHAHIDLVA
jgi:hypothetical protein